VGVDKTEIGTIFDTIRELVNNHSSDHLLTFYDLGSAKMNLEMVKDLSDKSITIKVLSDCFKKLPKMLLLK